MGGSGKTPHIEYLIRLLERNHYRIAMLSLGYGRKTKGFRFVDATSSTQDVGDEPLLLYKKHRSITVCVDKNRINGLNKIFAKAPDTDLVLLDDAYQYLPLKPGLSVLLTDYYNNYISDHVVPMGKLREGRWAAKDADIIIVTKSPLVIPVLEERIIMEKINPLPHQTVYFSHIAFGEITPLTHKAKSFSVESIQSVVIVCGIANPYPFLEYVNNRFAEKQQLVFSDHHCFTVSDIQKMSKYADRSMRKNCSVITTEKDAIRLMDSKLKTEVEQLPIFYIPIEVTFHPKYKTKFEEQIHEYVKANTTHR
jgi:tetraacyldisaccharide 4'-kinase